MGTVRGGGGAAELGPAGFPGGAENGWVDEPAAVEPAGAPCPALFPSISRERQEEA